LFGKPIYVLLKAVIGFKEKRRGRLCFLSSAYFRFLRAKAAATAIMSTTTATIAM